MMVRHFLVLCMLLGLAEMLVGCGPNLNQLDASHGLYINAVLLTGASSGWAVGLQPGPNRAVLLRETNGAWQPDAAPPPSGSGDTLKALATSGPTLWIAGAHADAAHGDATHINGFVFSRAGDGGWHRTDFGAAINALAFLPDGEGWAAGNGGALFHFAKATWTQYPNDMSNDLFGLAFRAPNDGWAVGDLGAFAHFDGTTWRHQDHFTHAVVAAVALSPDDGWAVGTDGTTFRLGTLGWFSVATPMNVTNRAVTIVGGNVWVAGEHGSLFERISATGEWQHIAPLGDVQLNAIGVSTTGAVWVGGNFAQSAIFTLAGNSWRANAIPLATNAQA